MEKKLLPWRKIILVTAGMIIFNLLLSLKLTNVTPDQTGIQTISWNEIFLYTGQFSILLYVTYLLSLSKKIADFGKNTISFLVVHRDVIFLCVIFIYLAFYEIYCAYFSNHYISPDSSGYMREASSLLAGNGFRVDKLAGYDEIWFSSWPIGYPALIAAATFLSGHSIYLSSKLLSIALVGFGLFVLRLRFKKDAWIFSLIYLNVGFLTIYGYTWSENPFILCLIIWGVALSAIVEETEPKKRYFAVASLGILGAFISRYFGIITILFTGIIFLMYLCRFIKNQDAFILPKIKGLFCVELISSVIVGLYLLMNHIMSGYISGVDRQRWNDNYSDLVNNLYDALTKEIFYATRVEIISLMPDFSPWGKAVVIFFFLMILTIILFKNYQKERQFDYKTVFIGFGLFYFFVFIIVRFHSSMDSFGYRFFAPAGMMVSIGVLGLIKDRFGERLKSIQIAMCLFLLILCGGLAQKIKDCTVETSAYYTFYNQVTCTAKGIPPKGMLLNYDGEYTLLAFRPDIMITGQVAYDDTIENIIARYNRSDSIWIRRGILNTIVNDESYSDNIRNAFSQYVIAEADDGEYIRLY